MSGCGLTIYTEFKHKFNTFGSYTVNIIKKTMQRKC